MKTTSRAWLWIAAAASVVAGIVLVMNNSSAGWFLIIMGIVDIGAVARARPRAVVSNEGLVRWGLVVATGLLVLLALIGGALLLPK